MAYKCKVRLFETYEFCLQYLLEKCKVRLLQTHELACNNYAVNTW